jgi:predicted Zn-dependent protease
MNCSRYLQGRLPYVVASMTGVGLGVVTAIVMTYSPPLTTHRVVVPLNSAATTVPVPLEGLADLPKLLTGQDKSQRWAIVGGALMQVGLSRLSIPALEYAVARNPHNNVFHVALGEALALANGGQISERAKAEFEIALQSDPNDLVARFYMAHWLLQNGKPKPALVKWVGLMRTVGSDQTWYYHLWTVMPVAAQQVGMSQLALQALCVAGM